ncbi:MULTISPECIES: Gfo/Idh/MocA family oxidoreductase [unclassified Pseudomonas]|uniref:Gfo/Idh/MocA family protein n=1 Tax=unclassified Pseudomonas TaxID=196821 RepID=UPI002AC9919F|nr:MULTISPECIES: Gfo/Idh/MocA family oxidoreductase [unclassified Pseudomonas]MEB0040859.1 Gfo/Idh/MocA family oxidoreductase [Pseudomonas sp. MH10]MEB0079595.1 Gfo/Idh/MocA family oxidoreductase [Pseudomonas sp. MH10out]MEB0102692.1 Gfo/Idh/MocA family oxidoreductase [Pseudomonas sp. CCI3.2]MEB0119422.1 Gfo/Idh/MocA family oxidoreductase [Pseudomonas sp. CCI1.2]MEB0132508.1 Gfo/Idh/MocA family oxidoreductase [Pseudomonas sp. CCI2.4]
MRIGLVGYGKGGRYFHAPLIASLPGASFVGVVTRSPERRLELAQDYPNVLAFDTLAALVGNGVDAVVISTPLASRRALILEAIELGVAVVSDKPFANDAAQARELVEAAERRGVLLSVYQNRRWDSDFLTVRKLINNGVLGDITRFESRVERYSPKSVGKVSGGGMLRDLGSHLVDQALLLFGPVSRVYAELDFSTSDKELDHGFFVSLTHASGVVSHLWGSCLQNCPGPRFRVSGSAGCYSVEGLDGQEASTLAGLSPKSEGDNWGVEEHRRWGWFEQGEQRERIPSERGCWNEFYRQLQDAVAGKGNNPVDARDAVASAVVLDAARASAESGTVIKL